MPPAMLTTVDERGWCEHVEGADGLAVVFFFAPWCRTCKAVRPVVERLERSHEDVSFFQADFKQSAALCYRQRVFAFPTVHFYLPGVGRVGRCVPSAKGADARLRSQLSRFAGERQLLLRQVSTEALQPVVRYHELVSALQALANVAGQGEAPEAPPEAPSAERDRLRSMVEAGERVGNAAPPASQHPLHPLAFGGRTGAGRSYAPRRAARASWRVAVA